MKYLLLIVALLVALVGVSAVDTGNTLYQNPTGAGQSGAVTADMCKMASGVWTGTGCRIMPSYEEQKMNCYKSGGQWYVNGLVSDGNWGCNDGNKTQFEQEQVRTTVSVERSTITGWENITIKLKYNQSIQNIEGNLGRIIAAQRGDVLSRINGAVVQKDNDTTTLIGFTKARFLGIFPFQKRVEFNMDAAGTVTQKKNFLDILTTQG